MPSAAAPASAWPLSRDSTMPDAAPSPAVWPVSWASDSICARSLISCWYAAIAAGLPASIPALSSSGTSRPADSASRTTSETWPSIAPAICAIATAGVEDPFAMPSANPLGSATPIRCAMATRLLICLLTSGDQPSSDAASVIVWIASSYSSAELPRALAASARLVSLRAWARAVCSDRSIASPHCSDSWASLGTSPSAVFSTSATIASTADA